MSTQDSGNGAVDHFHLAAGYRLGPYEIVAPLGAGGMGQVYRAHDDRLHRDVALKVLPPALVADPARRTRLIQEARAASALEHPHIAVVHDIGEDHGLTFIAMELVRGEPLSEILMRGPLPVLRSLDLAIEITEALARAHATGIVHRDLKPANVMVTAEGHAKIIDFGLAKLVDGLGGGSRALTVADQVSQPGVVLGTIAYMSPEQARGAAVDQRSDIFSFGEMLYEMVVGRTPFGRRTSVDTLHAIVYEPLPPLPASLVETAGDLEPILQKCLAKEPNDRYQGIPDLVVDLRSARRRVDSIAAGGPPLREAASSRRSRIAASWPRRIWIYSAGAAAIAAAVIAAVLMWTPRSSLIPATEWEQITDYADSVSSPALSSDGRMLVFLRGPRTFSTTGDVYAMVLPKGPRLQLTHDGAQEKMDPVFSPDGSTVAYTVPFHTWTVPVAGGEPRLWLTNAASLRWTDQNALLFSQLKVGSKTPTGMHVVTSDASRTRERIVYSPEDPSGMAHRSHLSPDGKWLLIAAEMVRRPPWVWLPCRVVPFDGSSPPRFVGPPGAGCTAAAWAPDGKWMYFVNNAGGAFHIWRQRFPAGRPEQLTAGATEEEGLAVSPDGLSLVTAVGTRRVAIVLHDHGSERPIASEGRPRLAQVQNGSPFSRDGKKLYYLQPSRTSNDVGSAMLTSYTVGELWATDLETGQSEAVFPGLAITSFGLASDGNRIVFTTSDAPRPRLWIATLDRGLSPRRLPVDGAELPRFAGDFIYYLAREGDGTTAATRPVLHRIKPDGTGGEALRTSEFFRAAVSPSGRFLALTTRQDTAVQIFRLAIVDPQTGESTPVCAGCSGWWSDDGKWFAIARQTGSGDQVGICLLPTGAGTELPELPPGGFASIEDAVRAKGARVINQAGEVALSPTPDRYAFVRETVQRNLFRIPLR